MESQILANAELVKKVARSELNTNVEYNEAGVQWLERYIDGQRQFASEEVKQKLPSTLGSFLGECVRSTFGGQWVQDPEYGWAVKVTEGLVVFPFAKVRKQLEHSEGESVLGLFRSIPAVMAHLAAKTLPAKAEGSKHAPWWKLW
jgi:hypothetical protein